MTKWTRIRPRDLERQPLIPLLRRKGIEVDQRLRFILSQCPNRITDADIFYGLYRTNSLATRRLAISREDRWAASVAGFGHRARDPEAIRYGISSGDAGSVAVLHFALKQRRQRDTLGSLDFFRAILELGAKHGDDWSLRPWSVDLLSVAYSGEDTTLVSEQPELVSLLQELQATGLAAEDVQYALALDAQGRIVFRPTSVLDDYVQTDGSAIYRPRRAILTHFQDQFCGFLTDQIEELSGLT